MARGRKSKPKRRTRRFRGLKVIPALASYASASAITQLMFNNNLFTFLTYDWMGSGRGPSGTGLGQGQYNMTLAELVKAFAGTQPMSQLLGSKTLGQNIMQNVADNWSSQVPMMIGAAVLPKVLNKLPGRPIQAANRTLKMIGVGDFVKL